MIEWTKKDITPILKDYYRRELMELFLQSWEFQEKYGVSFAEYEKQVYQAEEENFDAWDDYMEWKACEKSIEDREKKLKALRDGNFTVVT